LLEWLYTIFHHMEPFLCHCHSCVSLSLMCIFEELRFS
jgi:hypothetical protein